LAGERVGVGVGVRLADDAPSRTVVSRASEVHASYGRIAPIGSSYIESTSGYRDNEPTSSRKRVLIGLGLIATGVVLLIVGL
jgi:hypothetical protein